MQRTYATNKLDLYAIVLDCLSILGSNDDLSGDNGEALRGSQL